MNQRAQIRMLPDGRRLHIHDGPIDVIVEAFGEAREINRAYGAAAARFVTMLDELCSELWFCVSPLAWKDRYLTVLSHGAWLALCGLMLGRPSSRPWRPWRVRWRKRFSVS